MGTSLRFARLIFTIVLAGLFLKLFGYPALMKYLESSVLIKVSTLLPLKDGIPPPAITFCPLTPVLPYPTGWKNSTGEFRHVLHAECGQEFTNIADCVRQKTYKLNETLMGANAGMINPHPLLNSSLWTSYLTTLQFGNCFTLEYSELFTADFEKHSIWLHFDKNLMYDVYIHDPNFFLITNNLQVIPQARIRKIRSLTSKLQFDMYPITVTEHRNINRAKSPCAEDVNYNFMTCVNKMLEAKVGCQYPWNQKNSNNLPHCRDMEMILELEKDFFDLGKLERKDVIEKTGCLIPCRYREYKILNDMMKGLTTGFGIGMMFPSTEIRLEEEEYIYPLLSFISELGGALGMFLGFSFIMIWDYMLFIFSFTRLIKS